MEAGDIIHYTGTGCYYLFELSHVDFDGETKLWPVPGTVIIRSVNHTVWLHANDKAQSSSLLKDRCTPASAGQAHIYGNFKTV